MLYSCLPINVKLIVSFCALIVLLRASVIRGPFCFVCIVFSPESYHLFNSPTVL
jgi:hypothetical protein